MCFLRKRNVYSYLCKFSLFSLELLLLGIFGYEKKHQNVLFCRYLAMSVLELAVEQHERTETLPAILMMTAS